MRLDNGAINGAGQGHNETTTGVDRTSHVCITLSRNTLSTRMIRGPSKIGIPALDRQSVKPPENRYAMVVNDDGGRRHARLRPPGDVATSSDYYAA